MSTFLEIVDPDNDRFEAFERWVQDVRDPANAATEGRRTITSANKRASASYEIAPLPDGRWAMKLSCDYKSGTMSSVGSPWTAFESRDECVTSFLQSAKSHFSRELIDANCAATQQAAQTQMLSLLTGTGLFGFLEPNVDS